MSTRILLTNKHVNFLRVVSSVEDTVDNSVRTLPVMLSPANAWNSMMAFLMASAAMIVPELGFRTWGFR